MPWSTRALTSSYNNHGLMQTRSMQECIDKFQTVVQRVADMSVADQQNKFTAGLKSAIKENKFTAGPKSAIKEKMEVVGKMHGLNLLLFMDGRLGSSCEFVQLLCCSLVCNLPEKCWESVVPVRMTSNFDSSNGRTTASPLLQTSSAEWVC